jgi:hypothetical protein
MMRADQAGRSGAGASADPEGSIPAIRDVEN